MVSHSRAVLSMTIEVGLEKEGGSGGIDVLTAIASGKAHKGERAVCLGGCEAFVDAFDWHGETLLDSVNPALGELSLSAAIAGKSEW